MAFLTDGTTSSASKEWGSPDSLYEPLHEVYDFTLDGAASHANTKLPRYCTADGTFEVAGGNAYPPETPLVEYERDGNHRASILIDPRDGLTFPWEGERVFLNPPWGEAEQPCVPRCTKKGCKDRGWHTPIYIPGVEDFMQKVRNEFLRHRVLVVCLLPARTDTRWFHRYVLPYARIQYLEGRVRYIDPETDSRAAAGMKPREGPPVGSIIATYR